MNDDSQAQPHGLRSRPVRRRDILKLGATGAMLPAALGPATIVERGNAASIVKASIPDVPTGPVSLGYWNGDPDSALANARSLAAGDPKLARSGALVQMIGMGQAGDLAQQSRLKSLALDLGFGDAQFRAWQYENLGVQNVSAPSTFRLPVDERQGLRFTVRAAHHGITGAPRAQSFLLSTGSQPTLAKLQPGFYVLAVGRAGRSLRVNWSNFQITGDSTGQSFSLRKNGKPVDDFSYLIFSIAARTASATFI